MTMMHKAAPIRLKAVAGEDGVFEGYGSVFSVIDSVGDVVAPGAYAATLAQHASDGTRPKGLWQHDPSRPVLTWLEMREDERGLWCKGRLILDVQQAREAHALMKAGELDGLSIGFEATEVEFARPEDYEAKYGSPLPPMAWMAAGQQVRVLKAVDLWEVSLVTFPACAPARLTSVKRTVAPSSSVAGDLAVAMSRRAAALHQLIA